MSAGTALEGGAALNAVVGLQQHPVLCRWCLASREMKTGSERGWGVGSEFDALLQAGPATGKRRAEQQRCGCRVRIGVP